MPKQLLHAQAGSVQIWIPKRAPKEAEPTPTTKKRTAKTHKRKPRQPRPAIVTPPKNSGYGNPKRVDNSASTSTNQPLQTHKLPQQQQTRTKHDLAEKEHNADLGSDNPTTIEHRQTITTIANQALWTTQCKYPQIIKQEIVRMSTLAFPADALGPYCSKTQILAQHSLPMHKSLTHIGSTSTLH